MGALLVWLLSAGVSLLTVTSASSMSREWRQALLLEPTQDNQRDWNQCGFCITTTRPDRLKELLATIPFVTDQQIENCRRGLADGGCDYIPWEYSSLLTQIPRETENSAFLDFEPIYPSTERGSPTRRRYLESAIAANFRPKVELYVSPLRMADFPRVWGLVCSFILLFVAVVAVPLRLTAALGAQLYHQTWSLLAATQRPVKQIVFALCLQALAPLALICAPLWATSVLAMSLSAGLLTAFWLTLALVTVVCVWSAFGVTLPALAGRHASPAMLVLFCLALPLAYALVVFNLDPMAMRTAGQSFPRMLLHSGFDFWRAAQEGFGAQGYRFTASESPMLARILASGALCLASLLWIGAHAGRFQAQRKASLSRRAWLSCWGLAGLVLGLRWYAGYELMSSDPSWTLSSGMDEIGLVLLWLLPIPCVAYLATPLHPGAHRPDARLNYAAWMRSLRMSVLGILVCLAGYVFGSLGAFLPLLADVPVREILLSAILLSLWCVFASGLSTIFAKGLDSVGAKLGFFGATALCVAMLPGIGYHLIDRSFRCWSGASFCSPRFLAFQLLLSVVVFGILAHRMRKDTRRFGA